MFPYSLIPRNKSTLLYLVCILLRIKYPLTHNFSIKIHSYNMRLFSLFLILIAFSACKTKTEIAKQKQLKFIQTKCPEGGNCDAQIQQNKQLLIKTEEATGFLYPEIIEGNSLVIQFEYSKKGPANIADANYSETIYFEVPKDVVELNIKDKELADVNLLYGKHCFCEGAGYYSISNGELSVKKQDNKLSFELTFEAEGTQSVLQHIIETIEIE